jgi:hypothetical protein
VSVSKADDENKQPKKGDWEMFSSDLTSFSNLSRRRQDSDICNSVLNQICVQMEQITIEKRKQKKNNNNRKSITWKETASNRQSNRREKVEKSEHVCFWNEMHVSDSYNNDR